MLEIRNSVISGNGGNGVFRHGGNMLIEDSTVTNNAINPASTNKYPAGVYIYGNRYAETDVTVTRSTISHNQAAGITDPNYLAGDLTIENSTTSGNAGDGIYNWAYMKLRNSTVSENGNHGVDARFSTDIENSTIHGNTGSGVFSQYDYQVSIRNSIVSGSRAGPDRSG